MLNMNDKLIAIRVGVDSNPVVPSAVETGKEKEEGVRKVMGDGSEVLSTLSRDRKKERKAMHTSPNQQ